VVPIKARGRYTLCSAIHRAEGVRRVRNGDFWKSELFAKDLPSEWKANSFSDSELTKPICSISKGAAPGFFQEPLPFTQHYFARL
jgi:hypothetical protein